MGEQMKRFNIIDRNGEETPVDNVDDYVWENGSVSFLKDGQKVVSLNADNMLSVRDCEWENKDELKYEVAHEMYELLGELKEVVGGAYPEIIEKTLARARGVE